MGQQYSGKDFVTLCIKLGKRFENVLWCNNTFQKHIQKTIGFRLVLEMHQTAAFALAGLWLQRLLWRLLSGAKATPFALAGLWLQRQRCPAVPLLWRLSCLARSPQCTLLVSAGQYKTSWNLGLFLVSNSHLYWEDVNKEKKNIIKSPFIHCK